MALTAGEDGYYTNVYTLPEELWSTELDKLQPDSYGKVELCGRAGCFIYNEYCSHQ